MATGSYGQARTGESISRQPHQGGEGAGREPSILKNKGHSSS